jgi:alkylation response protein AidB-like acyl-CoA dehydrogenase
MDFSFTDEQKAIAELAGEILADHCTLERLKAVEASPERYDAALWAACARAGLLGAALPEALGGSGGGLLELCLILEQQGRRVAPIPLVASVVSAAMPLARFGSDAQQQRLLPDFIAGNALLSAALTEQGADSRRPATVATADGRGWRLSGVKVGVPIAERAVAVLVPARTAEGQVGVFIVDPRGTGVRLAPQVPTNWEPQARLELADVVVRPDAVLGSVAQGAEILDWIVDRTTVALCAIAAGACQAALQITAQYAATRKQFGKPIGSFQAVGQRLGDSYIAHEAVNLTMWQAASRLADEIPSAKEVAVAKYWAAEGGSRIGHAALHIHGGIGIDIDYPIHRYFLWIKQSENTLGAATPQLVRLGGLLAA